MKARACHIWPTLCHFYAAYDSFPIRKFALNGENSCTTGRKSVLPTRKIRIQKNLIITSIVIKEFSENFQIFSLK